MLVILCELILHFYPHDHDEFDIQFLGEFTFRRVSPHS